jgi:hypothetical protein
MKKALIVLALALILSPNMAFAATPNAQYISFLKQEIIELQAELDTLQTTPTTTESIVTPSEATTTDWCSTIYWASHCSYFED